MCWWSWILSRQRVPTNVAICNPIWAGNFKLDTHKPSCPLASVPDILARSAPLFSSWWSPARAWTGSLAVWSHPTPVDCATKETEWLDPKSLRPENPPLTAIFFRAFIILTIAASISCFRSSSTLLRVSFRSGSDSPLAATVWILTLWYNYEAWQFDFKICCSKIGTYLWNFDTNASFT